MPAGERLLLEEIERVLFPPAAPAAARRMGAEVEVIPVLAATREACPLVRANGSPTSVGLVRRAAAHNGWKERQSLSGAPSFHLPDGARITFEPGGQIELGSPACTSASALIGHLDDAMVALEGAAASSGVELVALGIDPYNDLDSVPLQLLSKRYVRMDELFRSVSLAGGRMMRQTASMHLNLDSAGDPVREWRMLNALAPYLVAIFANSSLYAGVLTTHQSFRAHCWRMLEPSRTGLPYDEHDVALGYLNFALGARAITVAEDASTFPPFRQWIDFHGLELEEWHAHLTTLFPEIRPRGYFEVRCIDALPREWYPAPIALLGGLLYDDRGFAEACGMLDAPDPALLVRAGVAGLQEPHVAAVAADLCRLALQGCERLGTEFISRTHLDIAREFFDRYTLQRRSPADDARQACLT